MLSFLLLSHIAAQAPDPRPPAEAWPRPGKPRTTQTDRRRLTPTDAAYCGNTRITSGTSSCTNDAYVRGPYVQFATHKTANSFGSSSTANPDSSFKIKSNNNKLGFVADYGKDGWTGKPGVFRRLLHTGLAV